MPGVKRGDVVERDAAEPATRARSGAPIACSVERFSRASRAGAPRTARCPRCRSSPGRRRPAGAAPWRRRRSARRGRRPSGDRAAPTARACRRSATMSTSTTPGHRLGARRPAALPSFSSVARSGPLIRNWIVGVLRAAAADGRDRLDRRAQVRRRACGRISVADGGHDGELVARRARRAASAGRRSSARLRVCAGSSPTVDQRVGDLRKPLRGPRGDRGWRSARSPSRLVPSGARTLISNSRLVVLRQEVLVGHDEQRHARQRAPATATTATIAAVAPATTRASGVYAASTARKIARVLRRVLVLAVRLRPSASAPPASASA